MITAALRSPGSDDEVVPIVRRTLHDEIVGRIRDMIIEGTLAPGSRVHEGQLGQALGISRTPLREALKFLASEGLIDLVPGRGAIVRQLTKRDVRNMLDVLVALETMAGRRACEHATDAQIAAVRAQHDAMMGFYAARNRLEYYKLNQSIHAAIATLSDNEFLSASHESIQSKLRRIRFVGNEEASKWQGAAAEHGEMIVALEARDGDRLAEVIARHLEKTWDRVCDIV